MGHDTINSDATVEYVTLRPLTNTSTLRSGFLYGSAPILMSCNNGEIIGFEAITAVVMNVTILQCYTYCMENVVCCSAVVGREICFFVEPLFSNGF
jgi:hypothetical protein